MAMTTQRRTAGRIAAGWPAFTGPRGVSRLPFFAICLIWAGAALALQPIDDFVRGAEATHPELQEANAVRAQRDAEKHMATWRLLPSFAASGSYTRNQYEIVVTFPDRSGPEPIIAQDQFDAALELSVPLVNVAAWEAKAASSAQLDLADASAEVTRLDLRRRVARSYYQLVATSAVRRVAEQSLVLARESASVATARRNDGAATQLEVERATAEVARAEQDVTAATLSETLARRELRTLTGVEPAGVGEFPVDDLHPEAPLPEWTALTDSVPRLEAARAAERAAQKQTSAAKASLYPILSGSAKERFTNATALYGAEAFYAFQVGLTWKLDGASYYATKAASAQVTAAQARELGSRQRVEDDIFAAWHQVAAGLERARAARRQAEAAERARELAQSQYSEGMVVQLDALTARQTAFAADVARIQVDADLAYSRALLRILAARELSAAGPRGEAPRTRSATKTNERETAP